MIRQRERSRGLAAGEPRPRRHHGCSLLVLAIAMVVGTGGCQPSFGNPPDHPRHDDGEDGAFHARGKRYPFLCRGNNGVRGYIACPTTRLPDDQLSCDAIGCHGGFDYGANRDLAFRHLGGSEGPSCNTCHGKRWSDVGRDPRVPIDWNQVGRGD